MPWPIFGMHRNLQPLLEAISDFSILLDSFIRPDRTRIGHPFPLQLARCRVYVDVADLLPYLEQAFYLSTAEIRRP
jgi:hypothetical protein